MSGTMIVQRYVDARPTNYHDFSSPVASTTIDDWDDELYMSIGASNNTPGYPGGDGSAAGSYSVWTYTPTTDTWTKVLTGTTLTVGRGYDVYVGDDQVSFPGRAIDSRGTPNMGAPSYAGTANFWNLVGNPHASYIELADLLTANPTMDPTIYMLDNSGNYNAYTNSVEIP